MRSPEHHFLSTPPLASSDDSQPSTGHGVLVRVSLPIHRIHGPPPSLSHADYTRLLEMPGHLFSSPFFCQFHPLSELPIPASHGVLEPSQFCLVRWRPSVHLWFLSQGPSVLLCMAFMAPFPTFCDASQYSWAIHSTLASACNNMEHISVCISLQFNNPIELVIFNLSLSGSYVQSILLIL
jgi:hypothetical protein